MVIDPVGQSPPFLISSSSARDSTFPMSLHIYILQHSHERGEVNDHKTHDVCVAQHHQLEIMCLKIRKIKDSNLQMDHVHTLWLLTS